MTSQEIQPTPSPIDNWKSIMTEKYAQFNGRARRAELWWFALVNLVIFWVLAGLAFVLDGGLSAIFWFLYIVFWLATIVPSIAVGVRRLHDTNKSGAMLLLVLIPFVGGIIILVFYLIDGDRGENQYGPSPKYGAAA